MAVVKEEFYLTRWLVLRGIGIIFLCAFWSLSFQVWGLVGSDGILPVSELLQRAYEHYDLEAFYRFPTLSWLSSSDAALMAICVIGIILSLLLIAGIATIPVLLALWLTYLSAVINGQGFMLLQWDVLLLEVGFSAAFFAPFAVWPPFDEQPIPPNGGLWILRIILFKLMLLSGVVKLTSGDMAWRNLSALSYHFHTQPLPTWLGWYTHYLPSWLLETSVAAVFVIELIVPFMIFMGRNARQWACLLLAGLQFAIIFTGNYGFFNWLTIVLCLTLLDDHFYRRFLPEFIQPKWPKTRPISPELYWRTTAIWCVAITMFFLNFYKMVPFFLQGRAIGPTAQKTMDAVRPFIEPPAVVQRTLDWLRPYRVLNSYGLFAWMTKNRFEIEIQGSNDLKEWKPYVFKWKPGDLKERPAFIGPHMPRLDWRMWFAALGDARRNGWVYRVLKRLQEGSPSVNELFKKNPFPKSPPQYIRAVLYDYRFTTPEEKDKTGRWWRRTMLRMYTRVFKKEEWKRIRFTQPKKKKKTQDEPEEKTKSKKK